MPKSVTDADERAVSDTEERAVTDADERVVTDTDERVVTDTDERVVTDTDGGALSELDGASVVVTGGAGFVGSRIAAELADRCDVTVLDDLTTGDPAAVPAGADLVRGDVRDPQTAFETVDGADVVFHQAGVADDGLSVRKPVETHSREAGGTVTVLDAARSADARVVVASSASVYGDCPARPVRETAPKTPTTPHGIARLAADGYARSYADLYGLETVVLRYFDVYGTRRDGGVAGLPGEFAARAAADDILVLPGDGDRTRDFVHVEDVVRANLLAATTDGVGRAYNVGSGTEVGLRTAAERVLSAVDASTDPVVGADADAWQTEPVAALDRAREGLGYEPAVQFGDGVRTMVDRMQLGGR